MRRKLAHSLWLCLFLTLVGCGLRPLHQLTSPQFEGESAGLSEPVFSSIAIDTIPEYEGVILRETLQDLLHSQGKQTPRFLLGVALEWRSPAEEAIPRGQVQRVAVSARARYRLYWIEGAQNLLDGVVTERADFLATGSLYRRRQARQAAHSRLTDLLAARIIDRMRFYFLANPQFVGTPSEPKLSEPSEASEK